MTELMIGSPNVIPNAQNSMIRYDRNEFSGSSCHTKNSKTEIWYDRQRC